MSVTRSEVLEQLATISDAATQETTTIETLATTLEADESTIEAHIDRLAACELAQVRPDGRLRITITGEELLNLKTDEIVIIEPSPTESEK